MLEPERLKIASHANAAVDSFLDLLKRLFRDNPTVNYRLPIFRGMRVLSERPVEAFIARDNLAVESANRWV